MQRGGRQGDWDVFGEGLHRREGEAETKKAGGIFLVFLGQVQFLHLSIN